MTDTVKEVCQSVRSSDFHMREIAELAKDDPKGVRYFTKRYIKSVSYHTWELEDNEVEAAMRDNEDVADLVEDIIEAVLNAMGL